MTTRKDKIVCPWCGAEQRRRWYDKFNHLTSWDHQCEHIDHNCDQCGRPFEVRAEECVYYKTRKVGR